MLSSLFSLSVLLVLVRGSSVDLTVTAKATGSDVVEAVVRLIEQSCIFADDKLLLRRIAYAESKDGLAFSISMNGGIWQVDESSFLVSKSSISSSDSDKIKTSFGIDWSKVQYTDLEKPLYSGLAARLKINKYYSSADIPQTVNSQAAYWSVSYTVNVWANATNVYADASQFVSPSCSAPKADVVYVVDGSGSIGASNFATVKEFIVDVVSSFDISPQKVRVGLIQFSSTSIVEFNLNQTSTEAQIVAAVNSMTYLSGGTDSAAGLKSMSTMIQRQGRQGDGVPVVSIFLTDGQSNDQKETATEANSVHLQLPEVTIFSVGVGSSVDTQELDTIASKPSCLHVFSLATFSDITSFTSQILNEACKVPAHLQPSEEISGELEKDQYYYFKITVHKLKKGVKVQIKTSSGGVKTYFSWKVQNPSSALYDELVEAYFTNVDYTSISIDWDDTAPTNQDSQGANTQKRSADTTEPDVTANLYAAVVGTQTGKNKFTLKYTDSGHKLAGSVLLAILGFITASLTY